MSRVIDIAAEVISRALENPEDRPLCPSDFNLEQIENCLVICQKEGLDCGDCWKFALEKKAENGDS